MFLKKCRAGIRILTSCVSQANEWGIFSAREDKICTLKRQRNVLFVCRNWWNFHILWINKISKEPAERVCGKLSCMLVTMAIPIYARYENMIFSKRKNPVISSVSMINRSNLNTMEKKDYRQFENSMFWNRVFF